MASKKKLLQAAAGSAGGAGLDIPEVFSTYLYDGDSQDNRNIVNNIDLSGEGGLVWTKRRDATAHNFLIDTERGANKYIISNLTNAENSSYTNIVSSFNNNGYEIGSSSFVNNSAGEYASWTFRKAPKFFDVQTWTGTGGARTISHSLNTTVGTIIVKQTNASNNWFVYHRSLSTGSYPDAEDNFLMLNLTNAANDTTLWNSTAPTSTDFTVSNTLNTSSNTYVAYLFAHNNGDGDFGPDGDADIIKCGSYAGNGSTDGPEVDLGFEPQWLMFKRSDSTSSWFMYDVMRGIVTSGNDAYLLANEIDFENTGANFVDVTPTGFKITSSNSNINNSSGTYIYMAIRRGPLAEPENATDVFAVDQGDTTSTDPQFISNFPVDMAITRYVAGAAEHNVGSRITGATYGQTQNTNVFSGDGDFTWDYMNGWYASTRNTSHYSWMWKRAPSYFDAVAYTGNGTAGHTVSHNLGVAPEMMWVKRRDATDIWVVYNETVGNTGFLRLNDTNTVTTATVAWNDTSPTATDFTLGTYAAVNTSGSTYIAYLFATLAGISKVGSYTGNGGTQTIDCGFSSGARFVLIKRTDTANSWFVFDSVRGIVAGNDPYLQLNATSAEDELGGLDAIDPHSSGFIVNSNLSGINNNNGTFIFYAIA